MNGNGKTEKAALFAKKNAAFSHPSLKRKDTGVKLSENAHTSNRNGRRKAARINGFTVANGKRHIGIRVGTAEVDQAFGVGDPFGHPKNG